MFLPPKKLMSYKDDIDDLKLKYQQLLQKTENYCKTAVYWKSCHNQTVQSEITALQGTREKTIDQLMNDMVIAEDQFLSQNRKRFTSRNKFRRHLAEYMWDDKREFFCHSVNSLWNWLSISFARKCTHLLMYYESWTWQVDNYQSKA